MHKTELIESINHSMEISIPASIDPEMLQEFLAHHIDHLIHHDFQRLISLLYRLDISETRLRQMLEDNKDSDAGHIIAGLIIERQLQKIKTREQFRKDDNDIDEEEKW